MEQIHALEQCLVAWADCGVIVFAFAANRAELLVRAGRLLLGMHDKGGSLRRLLVDRGTCALRRPFVDQDVV